MKATVEEKRPEEAQQPAVKRSNRQSKGVFPTLIALVSLVCAGFALYTSMRLNPGEASQHQQVSPEMQAFQQAKEQLVLKVDTTEKKLETVQETLSRMEKRFNQSEGQQKYLPSDWVLLKARYVLELAQLNAHWGSDFETTIALLSQADEMLSSLHDAGLMEVRSAIATEKSQVERQEKVDITALLTQLDVAQSMLQKLKLPLAGKQQESRPTSSAVEKNQSTFYQTLQYSVDKLEKLVVIHHYEGDAKPIVSPMLAMLLREEILFALQEAEYALIQGNDALFHAFLGKAVKKVKQSYDTHEEDTQQLLQQLGNLQKATLVKNRIEVGETAAALLNRLIESNKEGHAVPSVNAEPLPKDKS